MYTQIFLRKFYFARLFLLMLARGHTKNASHHVCILSIKCPRSQRWRRRRKFVQCSKYVVFLPCLSYIFKGKNLLAVSANTVRLVLGHVFFPTIFRESCFSLLISLVWEGESIYIYIYFLIGTKRPEFYSFKVSIFRKITLGLQLIKEEQIKVCKKILIYCALSQRYSIFRDMTWKVAAKTRRYAEYFM